jgi:hypothetical protein
MAWSEACYFSTNLDYFTGAFQSKNLRRSLRRRIFACSLQQVRLIHGRGADPNSNFPRTQGSRLRGFSNSKHRLITMEIK